MYFSLFVNPGCCVFVSVNCSSDETCKHSRFWQNFPRFIGVFPPSHTGFTKFCVWQNLSNIAYFLSPNGLFQATNAPKYAVSRGFPQGLTGEAFDATPDPPVSGGGGHHLPDFTPLPSTTCLNTWTSDGSLFVILKSWHVWNCAAKSLLVTAPSLSHMERPTSRHHLSTISAHL